MTIPFVSFEDGESVLDWIGLCDALEAGHSHPKADIGDTFLYRDPDTMLSRAAWIDGLGSAVKTATIFPGNPKNGKPMINGLVCLYSDEDGTVEALLDFHLITKWKTAGDSLLAARKLARPDSRRILIVGAGTVGSSLCDAFHAGFPEAEVNIWNRTIARAKELAAGYSFASVAPSLEDAVAESDIIVTATMSSEPVVRGEWLRPGQHLNLIGAYRPDMRETDDTAMQRARVFVDSYDTTLEHIGELMMPLASGAITRDDVVADYYEMDQFQAGPDDITLFKNGGGAHLDLMTSRYVVDRWSAR